MCARLVSALFSCLALTTLAACAEVDEVWRFRDGGGGRYQLTVRYNGDLLRQIREVVGEARLRQLSPRPLPFDVAIWRRTLARVKGLNVKSCEEKTLDGGMIELSADVEFDSLRAMLHWEFLSCRTTSLVNAEVDGETRQTLTMNPLARLPVLRTGLSWWRLTEKSNDEKRTSAEGATDDKDELPTSVGARRTARAAVKLPAHTVAMLRQMIAPHLKQIRLSTTFHVPGTWTDRGRGAADEEGGTRATFTAPHIIAAMPPQLRMTWRPTSFAKIAPLHHMGDVRDGKQKSTSESEAK